MNIKNINYKKGTTIFNFSAYYVLLLDILVSLTVSNCNNIKLPACMKRFIFFVFSFCPLSSLIMRKHVYMYVRSNNDRITTGSMRVYLRTNNIVCFSCF